MRARNRVVVSTPENGRNVTRRLQGTQYKSPCGSACLTTLLPARRSSGHRHQHIKHCVTPLLCRLFNLPLTISSLNSHLSFPLLSNSSTAKVPHSLNNFRFCFQFPSEMAKSTLQMSWKLLLLAVCILEISCCAAAGTLHGSGKLAALVEEQPLVLTYHKGPLLSTNPIDVHVIWYGEFTPLQRSIVGDYVQSLAAKLHDKAKQPSVSAWWNTLSNYKGTVSNDAAPVSFARLGKQSLDKSCSLGKSLKRADIAALVESAVKSGALPLPGKASNAVYLVLTSADVAVEGFCMSSCGFHANLSPSSVTGNMLLPYAWVGNSESQCPGQCAWPFHQPMYGPQTPPLVAPNADVGIDGMIINIATVLAGTVTNPFNTGYFQGDAAAPLEAVSACTGIYGKGAYSGYPGELLVNTVSGASYNAHGIHGRQFLLPAIWDPASKTCKTLA